MGGPWSTMTAGPQVADEGSLSGDPYSAAACPEVLPENGPLPDLSEVRPFVTVPPASTVSRHSRGRRTRWSRASTASPRGRGAAGQPTRPDAPPSTLSRATAGWRSSWPTGPRLRAGHHVYRRQRRSHPGRRRPTGAFLTRWTPARQLQLRTTAPSVGCDDQSSAAPCARPRAPGLGDGMWLRHGRRGRRCRLDASTRLGRPRSRTRATCAPRTGPLVDRGRHRSWRRGAPRGEPLRAGRVLGLAVRTTGISDTGDPQRPHAELRPTRTPSATSTVPATASRRRRTRERRKNAPARPTPYAPRGSSDSSHLHQGQAGRGHEQRPVGRHELRIEGHHEDRRLRVGELHEGALGETLHRRPQRCPVNGLGVVATACTSGSAGAAGGR